MVDISLTASQVQPGTTDATFGQGTAGGTITAGQPLYIDTADGNKLKAADANAATPAFTVEGVALHAALSGQPIRYQQGGLITLGAGAAMTVGGVYVLSATAGGIAPVADLTSGWYASTLGVATTAAILALRIHNSGAIRA